MNNSRRLSQGFPFFLAFFGDFALGIELLALPLKGYALGANPLQLGVLGGASSALYSFFPLFAGKLGDRVGRRLPIRVFLLVYPILTSSYFLANSVAELIVLRFLEGGVWALYWPSLEALLAARGGRKSIRLYNLSWGAGALTGPLVGGVIVFLVGPSQTFLIITAVTLLVALLSLWLLPSAYEGVNSTSNQQKEPLEIIYLISAFGFGFVLTGFLSYFPVVATRYGLSAVYAGGFEGNLSLWRIGSFFAAGYLLDRLRRFSSKSLIFLTAAAFLLPLCLSFGSRTWFISTALLGFASGLLYAVSIHTVLEGGAARGSRAGIFESMIGFGSISGPIVMGGLAPLFGGPLAPYIVLALLAIPVAAFMFFARSKALII